MDKLKPILAQKFWILFGMVLIMPLVGYFMTKGKLAAEIQDRFTKLNGTFSGIPTGTGVPNDSWTNGLNDIVAKQNLHNRRANLELWAKQKELMFWPTDIAPIMAKAEYFKDLSQEQKGDQVLYKYPQSYPSQIRALWEIVDPLDDGMNLRDSDKRRKVAFAMADLHQSASMYQRDFQPTFGDIWAAQEDIWLQTELLNAIKRLNANAISQGDAFVKQLGKIQLFGGTKSTGEAAAAATGTAASGMMMGDMAGINPMAFGGSGQRSESTALSADINLAEEFDAQIENSGTGVGGAMAAMSTFGGTSGTPADAASTAAGGAATTVKRYLDFTEGQAYKRRGFTIKLIMDHRKVPALIAELMNSPFPVEIVRVHQAWYSDSGSGTGGASGMMASSGKGFTPFNPMGTFPGSDAAGISSAPAAGFTEPDGAGFGNTPTTSATAIPGGTGGTGSAAAMADPSLAHVAIVGVWTLYLPPQPNPNADQAPPTNSAAPAAGLAATPENVPVPTDTTAEAPATTEPKAATTEPAEGTSDEPKKSEDPATPKSEPDPSEKPAAEGDKPSADKPPAKQEAADKTDSATK